MIFYTSLKFLPKLHTTPFHRISPNQYREGSVFLGGALGKCLRWGLLCLILARYGTGPGRRSKYPQKPRPREYGAGDANCFFSGLEGPDQVELNGITDIGGKL
jgi:hypothetical protein